MNTDRIRRFLESHAYSIPATQNADEMLAVLDDVDAEVKKARKDVTDFSALLNDHRSHLRDTFAAAALTGMLADPSANNTNFEMVTKEAYRFADAMLKAREEK